MKDQGSNDQSAVRHLLLSYLLFRSRCSKRPNSLRIDIKCGKYWFIRSYTFWLVTTVTCLYKQIDAS